MFGDVGNRISAPIGEEKGMRGADAKSVRSRAGPWLECSTVETIVF